MPATKKSRRWEARARRLLTKVFSRYKLKPHPGDVQEVAEALKLAHAEGVHIGASLAARSRES